jgi:hypothetical protein
VFSPPLETPRVDEVRLGRKNPYNAGPVGTDIGTLGIGNCSETMRRYGLDRQFRGEIGALKHFGSPVNGRGALMLDIIQQHVP